MALNICFNSPTCASMTEHLGGIGSPAEGLFLVPTRPVSGLTSFLSPSLLTKLADGYAAVGNTEPDPSPSLRLKPSQPFTAQSHR